MKLESHLCLSNYDFPHLHVIEKEVSDGFCRSPQVPAQVRDWSARHQPERHPGEDGRVGRSAPVRQYIGDDHPARGAGQAGASPDRGLL